jgi:hypothetical protein
VVNNQRREVVTMANSVGSETDKAVQRAHSMAGVAGVLEIGALLFTIGGVVAGVFEFLAGGDAEIGAGIGITVAAIALGLTLWVLARALRLHGEYVAARLNSGTERRLGDRPPPPAPSP